MSDLIDKTKFVEPYYIEEAGFRGVKDYDIGTSLEIEAKTVRRKLGERGFLDRLKANGFNCVPVGTQVHPVNKTEYTIYAFDVEAAKFFVARYDNPIGEAYVAFLINLEKKVTELDILSKNDPIMAQIAYAQNLRYQQIKQGEKLLAHDSQLREHSEDIEQLKESTDNSYLTTIQKKSLKSLIDATALARGDIKFCGVIQRELKQLFNLNPTNDRWYHIPQKKYEKALDYVQGWGRR